jgi:hypothetical protein
MATLAGSSIGMNLLGLWLILTGLFAVLNVHLNSTATLGLAVLAIIAGLLILIQR